MKIALPVSDGKLCPHFGHCQEFAVFEVDEGKKKILGTEFLTPPPHEPGLLPKWLAERGVKLVIAGGMGMRAQQFFDEYGIQVIVGVEPATPGAVATSYLQGTLAAGENICDH